MTNKQVFAKNLKFYLSRVGKTPAALIDDLGFKSSTVYGWSSGATFPRMDKLQAIADYLNISVADLLDEKNQNKTDVETISTASLSFGARLRFIRKDKGDTQQDLANLLHVTQATINGYENGKTRPSQESLIQLANHWHVSVDYLLTGEQANFTADQFKAMREEIIEKDTRPHRMAAHKSGKDLSSRGLDPDDMAKMLDEFLRTPEGEKVLENHLAGKKFNPNNL